MIRMLIFMLIPKLISSLANKPIKQVKRLSTFPGPNQDLFLSQWKSIETMIDNLTIQPPVNNMGAQALANYNSVDRTSTGIAGVNYRFQTLIATMLSPQTKDLQTATGFNNLVRLVSPAPLTASNLAGYNEEEIGEFM